MVKKRGDFELQASSALLDAALLAAVAPYGSTRKYFERTGHWELAMRLEFLDLQDRFTSGLPPNKKELAAAMRRLNANYNTRYSVNMMPDLCEIALTVINSGKGEMGTDPDFNHFETSRWRMVPSTLERWAVEQQGSLRPFSLLSKFFHFLFPFEVPIFDSQASASIQMWSFFSADSGSQPRYAAKAISSTDGKHYKDLISFYDLVISSQTDGLSKLTDASRKLERSLINLPRRAAGRVITPLDVIDKHLWFAAGNPLVLGVASRR